MLVYRFIGLSESLRHSQSSNDIMLLCYFVTQFKPDQVLLQI